MRFRAFAIALAVAVLVPASARATVAISQFAVTPSTTQAGGHPNLAVSFALAEPSTGVRDLADHLPAGLSAGSQAIPYCTHRRLVRNLCPAKSKAGSLTVTVVAYGIEFHVGRDIFNVRPLAAEPLRLGVPIIGSYSRPGIAAELPAARRSSDGGLDLQVKGLPTEFAGYPVRLKGVTVKLKGVARLRVRKRIRKAPFLTNPATCTPATSVLEITSDDSPAAPVTGTSSFVPTGC
jgi:hypothetical protein